MPLALGLSVSDIVPVEVDISPTAAPFLGFGSLLILGSSPVIDVNERRRLYSGGDTALAAIATDFGTASAEYQAADAYFSQLPQPQQAYLGRWAQTATPGLLHGATLSAAASQLSVFSGITNGSFVISIDGTAKTLSGLNFAGALNLNGVAAVIDAALPSSVSVTWDPIYRRFTIVSGTTGAASSVGYASPASTGTDLSAILGLTAASGASAPVVGVVPETLLSAVALHADQSNQWYGLTVATTMPPADADHVAVAGFIEGTGLRLYGLTIQNPNVLDSTQTGDLASQLMSLGYKRTCSIFSSTSPYAIVSCFGVMFTTDFTAQNSTKTLKFKTLPGVIAELLPESQAATLVLKNCNAYVVFANNTSIVKEGVMANGYFFDEVHNLDWFANSVQTNNFNVLYQAPKVPQTDQGIGQLKNASTLSCVAAVYNGTAAEGLWTGASFGSLQQGKIIPGGFYVYAPSVNTQAPAGREKRLAPTQQIGLKLAGAVHFAGVIVNVNR